jgi:diadenylate cyclase
MRGDRIVAARCLLPLAEHPSMQGHFGTRHRAAIGITEQSDAVAIVISEETGIISVAHDGRIIRRLGGNRLASVLRTFYQGHSLHDLSQE